jgi:hypothetical protein
LIFESAKLWNYKIIEIDPINTVNIRREILEFEILFAAVTVSQLGVLSANILDPLEVNAAT